MREERWRGEEDVRPWGASILGLSAVTLLALSIFMPELHCETIDLLQNRLIDGWEGAVLIGLATLVAIGALLGLRHARWGWLSCGAGLAALVLTIYAGTGSRLIVLKGVPGVQGDVHAAPGIGLLAAGLAALIAIGAGAAIGLRDFRT